MVLFDRPLSRVARLTVDDLKIEQGRVAPRLGDTPFERPETLAGHVRELVMWRRSLAAAALPAHERRLFPGASPGRPVGELALGRRLRRRGIDCAANRRTALLELSGSVPAPCWPTCSACTSTPPPDGPSWLAATRGYLTLRQGG